MSTPILHTSALRVTAQAQANRLLHLLSLSSLCHRYITSLLLELCFAMSRPRVAPSMPRRSRLQPTLDIWAPPPNAAELAADIKRVKARLAQRAAVKVSVADVAAMRQEVPSVPRVARQRWLHAPTLESKESSLKGMCHSHLTSSPSMPFRSLHHSHSAHSSCAI